MQTIVYNYNKVSSGVYTIGLLGIIGASIPNLLKFVSNNDFTNWLLILIFDLLLFLMLVYIVFKQLIPALANKASLELNEIGIISYAKNVSAEWKDIDDIELRSTRTSSLLYVTFKFNTDHGTYIRIPLGFIAGSDDEIYNTALNYLKNSK